VVTCGQKPGEFPQQNAPLKGNINKNHTCKQWWLLFAQRYSPLLSLGCQDEGEQQHCWRTHASVQCLY